MANSFNVPSKQKKGKIATYSLVIFPNNFIKNVCYLNINNIHSYRLMLIHDVKKLYKRRTENEITFYAEYGKQDTLTYF